MPEIDKNLCIACGKCIEICGFGALKVVNDKAISDDEKCISCGMCVSHCPVDAISVGKVEKERSDLIKNWAETYAKANGFKLNPEEKVVDMVVNGLIMKEEKFGKKYCPCRLENVPENVCPCVYHKDEVEKDGQCHCMLFVK